MSSPYRSQVPNDDPHPPAGVVVTTGTEIPGWRVVTVLGVVRGIALRALFAHDTHPLEPYVRVRHAAETRLVEEAKRLGGEAVIGMRYDSNDAEVVAYGTAVRLERL